MQPWQYAILFLTVLAGGAIALHLKKYNPTYLKLILSFSGAYVLGITILHLMPDVYGNAESGTGFWVLIGFFLQLILEQLSRGVEHGHIHVHGQAKHNFALSVMIGLCLHAFIEGLPLNGYTEMHTSATEYPHNYLFFGILVHKAPTAFALAILLVWSEVKPVWIWICMSIFALMSPLGAFIASFFILDSQVVTKMVALVIGSFLHIATTILFEADDGRAHHISWRKMAVILAGLGIALLTL